MTEEWLGPCCNWSAAFQSAHRRSSCGGNFIGSAREFGIQLMFFLIFEHAILILQATVKFLISDSPVDVTDIGHYNEYVKKTMKKKMANDIYPAQTSLRHVDVSLNPDNIESEVESDSS